MCTLVFETFSRFFPGFSGVPAGETFLSEAGRIVSGSTVSNTELSEFFWAH